MKLKIPASLTARFVPNLDAVNLLEYFLISAVSSLIAIRAFLALTGYPQLGGGDFHIAHMLWGGFFMLAAIMTSISFINAESKTVASILGGIGFGTFIDELGKFITADNNYFYQPTIAIIYVIFIGIFLFIKFLSSIATYSSKTYTANALEGLKELVIMDLSRAEQSKTLQYLQMSNKKDALEKIIFELINNARPQKANSSSFERLKDALLKWYKQAVQIKFISRFLIIFFVLTTLAGFVISFLLLFSSQRADLSVSHTGYLLSSIAVGICVIVGVYNYSLRNRQRSFAYLQKATLIQLFFSQFFLFLQSELAAIFWFCLYISVYVILKYSMEVEKKG